MKARSFATPGRNFIHDICFAFCGLFAAGMAYGQARITGRFSEN